MLSITSSVHPFPLTIDETTISEETFKAAIIDGRTSTKGGLNTSMLAKIASLNKIRGYSKMRKADLVSSLKNLYYPSTNTSTASNASTASTSSTSSTSSTDAKESITDSAIYTGLMSHIQYRTLSGPVPVNSIKDRCKDSIKLTKAHARLQKEIIFLCNYGSTIFVRTWEEDMSYLEFMISGPADTPYQDGLFHFSMVLPAGFPTDPPVVKILNTGGGKIRHNPNLYADGKVCLSIVNTWQGEVKWTPTTSLSAVMVGIQNHIFNDQPWFNEPGHEHGPKSSLAISQTYNHIIRLGTVIEGMITMIKNLPEAFADVVIIHFEGPKKASIVKQISLWAMDAANLDESKITGYMKNQTHYVPKKKLIDLWNTLSI
jgi:ubiquitin-protein ligase